MLDVIHELYVKHIYPPMSHPLSDPAVSAVAARMSGLNTAHPAKARILEIGCCSGHNLIPLAMRWPESEFIGIDLAETSIREARERASGAGVGNVTFHAVDLRDFQADGGPFDFIIAHGFFSWVPDEVKAALLDFCRNHLSPSGIATVSFNVESGWTARLPVIHQTRAIQRAGGCDIVSALEILRTVTEPDSPEIAIIDDMLAKGPAILAFDDFGPVNDPWSLDRFVQAAEDAGLRWLGESDPGEAVGDLLREGKSELDFQHALDIAADRTFRSVVLCQSAAPLENPPHFERVLECSVRAGQEPHDSEDLKIWRTIHTFAPACVPLREVIEALPEMTSGELQRAISNGIKSGWILPRIEPLNYDPEVPESPRLNAFRLLCAKKALPLVDAWHKACAFPAAHYQVLAAMDGSRTYAELAAFSKSECPELAFEPWLHHLAWRGMFD